MMEAANTSETSVNFYQTTQHSNPEDNHLHEEICLRVVLFQMSCSKYPTQYQLYDRPHTILLEPSLIDVITITHSFILKNIKVNLRTDCL
jgi:hypothetical protein